MQRLAGLLNFLCHCIVSGRAFTTHFYVIIVGQNLKQHQHVKIREENQLDLLVWKQFLSRQDAFCCPFMECRHVMVDIINMYSNASGKIGFGALSGASWCYRTWNKDFLDKGPSIEYLELFALTVGIINWIHRFKNRKIILFCDNISMVYMVNNSSVKCRNCMVLIHWITLVSIQNNVHMFARYVNTKDNGLADALSQGDFARFLEIRTKYGCYRDTHSGRGLAYWENLDKLMQTFYSVLANSYKNWQKSNNRSDSSKISLQDMSIIMEKLKSAQYRMSTAKM